MNHTFDEIWITDLEKDLIAAKYTDGRYVAWNLDGDLLYDGYPDLPL